MSAINGFLIINKEKGITSFDVVRKVRRALNIKKVGHAGTLDPLATGVMVVAVGEGTKLLEYLLKSDKRYYALVHCGASSDTYDAEGVLTPGDEEKFKEVEKDLNKEKLKQVLHDNFEGEIDQMPPKYSALKIKGKRAADIMRKGGDVELKSRKVMIHSIEVNSVKWPQLMLDVHCGSGTYIRSLAHDLGQLLGCSAYLEALERYEVGSFSLEESHGFDEDLSLCVLPLEKGVEHMQRVELREVELKRISMGQFVPNRWKVKGVAAAFYEGGLRGIVEDCAIGTQLKFKKKLNIL